MHVLPWQHPTMQFAGPQLAPPPPVPPPAPPPVPPPAPPPIGGTTHVPDSGLHTRPRLVQFEHDRPEAPQLVLFRLLGKLRHVVPWQQPAQFEALHVAAP